MKATNPLKSAILFILITEVLFLVPSCVSKKKFVALAEEHSVTKEKVIVLREENEILRNDFEVYRGLSEQEILNKQGVIDSLAMTINSLNSDITTKKGNIEDQLFSFQLENGKLTQQLNEKEKDIRNLNRELNTLKVQVDDLTRELENAKSGFKFPFGNVKQLERKIAAKDNEIFSLDSSLSIAKEEIILLNETVNRQNGIIEKLTFVKDSADSAPVLK
jgi:chromosome segregation ATPase